MPRPDNRRRLPGGRPPWPVIVLAAAGSAIFIAPLFAIVWRAPWSDVASVLGQPEVRAALRLSAVCSASATVIAVAFGIPIAWVLARTSFPGRQLVRSLLVLPMILPPVVGGVALLFAFGRLGVVGQHLDRWWGWRLAFTTPGVVLAETFVAMPFFIVTVEAALRALDPRHEEAARTLGASRWHAFRRVTLPSIAPALVAGTVLTWARALGEFGATITFAGNLPGTTQTAPLKVYLALESSSSDALVLSLVLVAIAVAVLVGLRDQWLGGGRIIGAP